MDTSSDESAENAAEKDKESSLEPRKEVNSSMPGFELISENEKKVRSCYRIDLYIKDVVITVSLYRICNCFAFVRTSHQE